MQKHICECRKGALPVNPLMSIKTLVLDSDKGVDEILRYSLVGFVLFLCPFRVVRHPYSVKLAVQTAVFGVISADVV